MSEAEMSDHMHLPATDFMPELCGISPPALPPRLRRQSGRSGMKNEVRGVFFTSERAQGLRSALLASDWLCVLRLCASCLQHATRNAGISRYVAFRRM